MHNITAQSLICRLCLCDEDGLLSIFKEKYNFLPQRIASCVNVEININDKLPTSICKRCFEKVEGWYDFKKCCESSQNKLIDWTNTSEKSQNVVVKEEIEEILVNAEVEQLLENSIYIKPEPFEIQYESESNSPELNTTPSGLDNIQISSYSLEEDDENSLLVPADECAADDHGKNVPHSKNGEFSSKISNKTSKTNSYSKADTSCSFCSKNFSSYHNRMRHERNIHNGEQLNSDNCLQLDDNFDHDLLTLPNDTDQNPLTLPNNAEQNHLDNNSDASSNVTLEQFVANVHLVKNQNQGKLQFVSEREFLNFNIKMHNQIESLKCDCCGVKFSNTKSLLRHLTKTIAIEAFSCFMCCIAFPNRSQFMKHARKNYCKERARTIQTGNLQIKAYQHYSCRECGILFVHKGLMFSHIFSTHLVPVREENQCTFCQQTFENQNEFKIHVQGPCYYKIYCSICKISYDNLNEFDKHSTIHDDNNTLPETYRFIKEEPVDDDLNEASSSTNTTTTTTTTTKYINCPKCPLRYTSNDTLFKHIDYAHKNIHIFKCTFPNCGMRFIKGTELTNHVKIDHANEQDVKLQHNNNYSCGQCGALFATLDEWCEHQKSHSINNIHKCEDCNRVFGTEIELEEHKDKQHIKLKLLRCSKSNSYKTVSDFTSASSDSPSFSCRICNKNFMSQEELVKHEEIPHRPRRASVSREKFDELQKNENEETEEKIRCTTCSKMFGTLTSLKRHKSHAHRKSPFIKNIVKKKKPRAFSCPICFQIFFSYKAMWSHKSQCTNDTDDNIKVENDIQNGANEPVCNICNKVFPTVKGMLIHSKLHSHREKNDELSQCQVCNMEFVNIESLLDHLKSHSTRSLNNLFHNNSVANTSNTSSTIENSPEKSGTTECHVCKKVCLNRAGLSSHLKIHLNEQPEPDVPYRCKICNIVMANGVSYSNHMRKHNPLNNRLVRCKICTKKLRNSVELKNHMIIMHPTKKRKHFVGSFSCQVCSKRFPSDALLKEHLKIHVKKTTTTVKKSKCNLCEKLLPSKMALSRHMHMHNDLYCKPCNRYFTSSFAKSSHVGWHKRKINTSIHSRKIFKCTFCQKVFHYLKALKSHVTARHTDPKDLTNDKFIKNPETLINTKSPKQVSNNEIEMKTEQIERIYKCRICNIMFNNPKGLRVHVQSVHQINL